MMRLPIIAALAGASMTLPGCVAALVPIAAASAMGGKQLFGSKTPDGAQDAASAGSKQQAKAERKRLKAEEKRARAEAKVNDTPPRSLAAPSMPAAATLPAAPPVPGGMQYLYASGEAAAVSLQSYLGLMNYLLAVSSDRSVGHPVQSVVLAPGSTLTNIKFEPCGKKPLALVVDVDETMLLNLGFEGDQIAQGGAYDQSRWDAWEKAATGSQVAAVPGALSAVSVARGANITVVFNSNRQAATADQTSALLAAVGLGSAVHGDTLWLQGDVATDPGPRSGKDARRAAISAKYCVVAMAGDQLGDFSDQFNAPTLPLAERRKLVATRDVLALWGHGWFMLPNPVYGTGLKGNMNDVFPPATRWTPPATDPAKPIAPKKDFN